MVRNVKWIGTLVATLVLLAACGTPSTGTSTDSGAASPSSSAAASGNAASSASSSTATSGSAAASGNAAASGSGASGGAVNVPVIVKAVTSDYWKTVCAGLDQATQADPSITTNCQGPNEESDVEGQIRIIEAAISSNPAAIAVAPSQADQVQPVLQRAIDAGIPVVLIDTDIPGFTTKSAFVGTDNQLGGQQAGEFIAEQLGGSGNVAIIRGAAGDPVHNLREEGAKAAMEAAGVTVVATQPANSDRAQGQSVAENLLTANPDLKAIYATNDEMALGAAQAAQAAGRSDLVIVGFDASPDALTAIEGGQMAGSIAQFPSKIGQLGLETAAKVARGETVEQFVNTGVDLVTQDNVAEFK
jgi:ribose transport system substrate-binding protein